MNENENKLRELQERFFYNETLEEIRDRKFLNVDMEQSFGKPDDQELLTALVNLESVYLSYGQEILNETGSRVLAQIPSLKSLTASRCLLTPRQLDLILSLPSLTDLYLNSLHDVSMLEQFRGKTHLKSLTLRLDEPIPAEFLDVLRTLPQLEELRLGHINFENLELLYFVAEALPNLKSFDWHHYDLTEAEFEQLVSLNLEKVKFHNYCGILPLDDLSFFEKCTRAKELSIMCVDTMTTFDWDFPQLEKLSIHFCQNLSYIDFAKCPNLKSLVISDASNDFGVQCKDLDSLENLETVILQIKSKGLFRALEMLPRLSYLDVQCTALEPEDIPSLSTLQNVNCLRITPSDDLTPEAIEPLQELPRVTSLTLYNVTDTAQLKAFLKKFPKLEYVCIQCPVNDEIIDALGEFPNVLKVAFWDCEQVTNEGIQTLFSRKYMQSIWMQKCGIERLEVRDLPNLSILNLQNWHDLGEAVFSNLPSLRSLPLSCPMLESLTISDLENLASLQLQNCRILDYMKLVRVPNIRYFNVLGCESLDLSGLFIFPKLRRLEMTYQQLKQDLVLETLQELPGLKHLFLDCKERKRKVDVIGLGIGFGKKCSPEESACPESEKARIRAALPKCNIQFGY